MGSHLSHKWELTVASRNSIWAPPSARPCSSVFQWLCPTDLPPKIPNTVENNLPVPSLNTGLTVCRNSLYTTHLQTETHKGEMKNSSGMFALPTIPEPKRSDLWYSYYVVSALEFLYCEGRWGSSLYDLHTDSCWQLPLSGLQMQSIILGASHIFTHLILMRRVMWPTATLQNQKRKSRQWVKQTGL